MFYIVKVLFSICWESF